VAGTIGRSRHGRRDSFENVILECHTLNGQNGNGGANGANGNASSGPITPPNELPPEALPEGLPPVLPPGVYPIIGREGLRPTARYSRLPGSLG
jgi:hypothetical protein